MIKLSIYGLPFLLVAYPIFNQFHVMMSNFFVFLIILYIAYLVYQNIHFEEKHNKAGKIINWLVIVTTVALFGFSIFILFNYFDVYIKEDNIYYGAIIEEKDMNNINTVCEYIKKREKEGCKVIVFSYKAMFYNSLLKINNGDFDLPMHGNLGKDGEDGLIEKISRLSGCELLITKDKNDIVQESDKARKFIIDNYMQTGEIEEFYIYKIKK